VFDESKEKNRGKQYATTSSANSQQALTYVRRFDSSVGRGDFKTKIGVGRVIQGMRREQQPKSSGY